MLHILLQYVRTFSEQISKACQNKEIAFICLLARCGVASWEKNNKFRPFVNSESVKQRQKIMDSQQFAGPQITSKEKLQSSNKLIKSGSHFVNFEGKF